MYTHTRTDRRRTSIGLRVFAEITPPPRQPCALARWLIRQPDKFVVWDTETTGLDDEAKICHIAIVDWTGTKLFESLINPGVPIPAEATRIHGITDERVQDAPTFADVYDLIRAALHRRRWVIYNAGYDVPRLNYECNRAGRLHITPAVFSHTVHAPPVFESYDDLEIYCAMEMFAEVYGDWHDYYGNYTWQSLETATKHYGIRTRQPAHNALADANATLQVLRHMALDEDHLTNSQEHD